LPWIYTCFLLVVAGTGDAKGGGLFLRYDYPVVKSAIRIENCTAEGNTLQGGGQARGGVICIEREGYLDSFANTGYAVDSPLWIENCMFQMNSLRGSAGSSGGAIFVSFWQTLRSYFSLRDSSMDNNVVVSDRSAAGGGLFFVQTYKCTSSAVLVSACQFQKNTLDTASLSSRGGGVVLKSEVGPGPTTTVRNSHFRSNSAGTGGSGGGLCLEASGGSQLVSVTDSSSFIGNWAGGSGGGLYFESAGGATLSVTNNSNFIHNEAGGKGGGVAVVQTTRNIPANIDMDYLPAYEIPTPGSGPTPPPPTPVPALCYDTVNASNGTSVFRKYAYASPYVLLDSTLFDSNRASGFGGSGGALYALDMRVNISRSNITSNEASQTGGGIYLESGTAALVVTGTADAPASISNNTAPSGGGTIYSGSSGDIDIHGNAVVDLAGSEGSGIIVIAGAELNLRGGGGTPSFSVVQCGVGEILNDNMTVFNQQSNDWAIDCASLTSINYPMINYTSPSCNLRR
jgi:predicted outer membrane repeat protein